MQEKKRKKKKSTAEQEEQYHFQFDYYSGYVIKLVGKDYSFTVAVFLYCDSVSDCFYEEEKQIGCMRMAGKY